MGTSFFYVVAMSTEAFVSAQSKFFGVHLVKRDILDIEPPCHRCFNILLILKPVAIAMFIDSWEDLP